MRWPTFVRVVGLALSLAVWPLGCNTSSEAPVGPHAVTETPAESEAEAAPAGALAAGMVRVRGTVRLAAGSELPGYTDAEIGRDPARPGVPEGCSPARASDARPLRLGQERGVGGILVTATGHLPHFQALPAGEPRTIPVGIRDCRLTPTLVVAAVGDTLELTNHSPRALITTFTTAPINEAQAPQHVRRIEITRPGVQRVECSMGAGCGRTEVVVLSHRVATVTDPEGHFELDVPAGAEVVLHAWHPLMGRQEGEARLTIDRSVAGQTQALDIEVAVVPRPENPPVVAAPAPAAGAPAPAAAAPRPAAPAPAAPAP